MSNIQKSQNSKPKAIRKSQNYKSVRKIRFLKTCPPTTLSSVRDSDILSLVKILGFISLIHRASKERDETLWSVHVYK